MNGQQKKISLYTDSSNETVSIKAYTYNLEGNKIEKIKLKNSEIFDENINKYWNSKKFTMPDINEGSVIEWEYEIRSLFYWRIDDMVFQYKIPVKYIDTQVISPEFFVFKNQSKGFFPINIDKRTITSTINFMRTSREGRMTQKTSYSQEKITYISHITQCILHNIPAITEEPFTNNLDNYITSLKFEITAYRPKYATHEYFNTTWDDVTKTIYKSPNFGSQLDKTSYFKEDLASSINMTAPTNEKVAQIFQFVKSKIKWNNYNNKYTADGVKKAYDAGVGNVAEINLMLVAMLREAGVNANPILVSTRDHGIPLFPTLEGFNYVIAGVEMDNHIILLDATELYSLPNVLPLRALNWEGRIVRKDGSSASIDLFPKNHSTKKVFLNAKLDPEAMVTGSSRTTYNNHNALNYRSKYNSQNDKDLLSKLEKDNQNIEIIDLKINNKEDIYKPIVQTLTFESDNQAEIIGDNIYFSPLLFLAEKENPFKLEERKFPVDFGAPWEEKYTISIKIPEGYVIESKPENAGYALPDNLGSYKYISIIKDNTLQILSNVKINIPIIGNNYYGMLKEFYKDMVGKQLEKVVLVKK